MRLTPYKNGITTKNKGTVIAIIKYCVRDDLIVTS